MNKRGQSTIFIIVGIVVFLIVILGIVFRGEIASTVGLSERISYPSEIQEVVDHIQDCVDSSAEEAVVNSGFRGGYYDLPQVSFYDNDLIVPYFYYNGYNYLPSNEEYANELEEYVEFLVMSCIYLDSFSGLEISVDEMTVDVEFLESVEFVVDYPLIINIEDIEDSEYGVYDSYDSTVDVDLMQIHDVVSEIVAYDTQNPEETDLEFLLNLGLSNVKYTPYEDGSYVYILEDNTAFNGEEVYTFMFATYVPVPEEYEDLDVESYWEMFL